MLDMDNSELIVILTCITLNLKKKKKNLSFLKRKKKRKINN